MADHDAYNVPMPSVGLPIRAPMDEEMRQYEALSQCMSKYTYLKSCLALVPPTVRTSALPLQIP